MAGERTGQLADELQRRGLAAPTRLLLEAHRPLRPLLAELAAVVSPVTRPLLGQRHARLTAYLEDERKYDELIDALDDAEHR